MALRLIQAGVGGMGVPWAKAVSESSDWEAVAYVDINPDNLSQAAKDHGMDRSCCFMDLDEALRKVNADALVDITPPQSREQVTTKALQAGLHVLSEKPLSDTLAGAKRIVGMAEVGQRVFMVSQNYRFSREPRTLRKLLKEQQMGSLGYVVVEFHKGPKFPGSFRLQMEQPLLADMSIHHLDLMRYIFNTDAKSIYARTTNPEWSWFQGDSTACLAIEMNNGLLINYSGSWVAQGPETPWTGNWRIECSKGAIYWQEGKIRLSSQDEALAEGDLLPMDRTGLAWSLREFYLSIQKGKEPETAGRDNLKSLAMVFAAIDSAKTGSPAMLKDYI